MDVILSFLKTIYIFFLCQFTKRKIILGPYHGEFGFEVTMNVGFALSLKRIYGERVIVVSSESSRGLYERFSRVLSLNYNFVNSGYGYGDCKDSTDLKSRFLEENAELSGSIFIDLSCLNVFLFKRLVNFEFYCLESPNAVIDPLSIAVHFRDVIKGGADKRENFTRDRADDLVNRLNLLGYRVLVIGHPSFSYCPTVNCIDCRSLDIDATLGTISSSYLVIGQLSGPIHLAHLCRRPVVTWAEGRERFKTIKMWNVFNMPCEIVTSNTFNPSINEILAKVERIEI